MSAIAAVKRCKAVLAVRRFNALHPVGTPVVAYPGSRPEVIPGARRIDTVTVTTAWLAGGHTPVVMVRDCGSWMALTHIDPKPAGGDES